MTASTLQLYIMCCGTWLGPVSNLKNLALATRKICFLGANYVETELWLHLPFLLVVLEEDWDHRPCKIPGTDPLKL
jgi:hypothetical protein